MDNELQSILDGVEHIAEITTGTSDSECTVAHIKSDHEDIYDLSSAVFRAFANSDKVIYEMTLKKGNLEDIFIELSEAADTAAETAVIGEPVEESEVEDA